MKQAATFLKHHTVWLGAAAGFAAAAVVTTALIIGIGGALNSGFDDTHTAMAQKTDTWSSIGADGAIDEVDVGEYRIVDGRLMFRASVVSGTIRSVYGVSFNRVPVNDNIAIQMRLRYRDNGVSAHVVVRLKRYKYSTGSTTTIMEFDSDSLPNSTRYQTQSVSQFIPGFRFNFNRFLYFVEVEMTRVNASGTPAFGGVTIHSIN